jgi:T5SS/PEP-CTERM-associated repeat protein
MNHANSAARRLAGITLAIAAAWPLQPAQAQFFTSSGSVSTFPTNFPINPAAPVLDFTGNTLSVGNAAPGSFSALTGALLKADMLTVGNAGNGSGTVTVTGAGTVAQFGGTNNRLEIGNWGTGTLTVSAGALVDATLNAAACSTGFCYGFVGNGAGSTGTLNVTGAGSEVRTLRNFVVGQAAVFTQARDGFDFGTPGGTTTAAVNVLNGGTLRTQNVSAGVGPYGGSAALGTEQAFATIVVDGAGSQWIATRNTIDNTGAFFAAGSGAGGHADITVRNGGQLIVDGTGGASTNFDSLVLGTNGGQGQLTVTGVGSAVKVQGNNPNIAIGVNAASSQGAMSVLSGATASAMFVTVGRNGGNGTLTIDGANSTMTLSGVGTPTSNGAAGINIARDGGTGQVTVSNGGSLLISDGGADSSTGSGSPFMNIGRDAGSFGAMTIAGPGSLVQVTSTSIAPSAGLPDNFNPFVAVGRFAGASGSLTVSGGGQLVLQGNALSTVANSHDTTLLIGGQNGATAGGTGTATVTGAGSAIRVQGVDAFIGVGRGAGANGTLNVTNKGTVTATSLLIGDTGGTGTVTLNNGTVALAGVRTDNVNLGAGVTVGRGTGGSGQLNLSNGSVFTITNLVSPGGMAVGGDQFVGGGTGAVSLSGGSSIQILGPVPGGGVTVGRDGNGTMTLAGGSSLLIGPTRGMSMGSEVGGVGTVSVTGGSAIVAGGMNLGTVAGASGTLTISGAGSNVTLSGTGTNGIPSAAFATVGRGGNGTATVSNGGVWSISDGGGDTRSGDSSPGMNVGRDAGSFGSLTISGPGSLVQIASTSLALPAGVPDNFNPFMAVGRFADATGQLLVSGGGQLLMQGNAVSTVADNRITYLGIGGFSDTVGGGSGSATVTGAGSAIAVSGSDAFISVGRGAGASGQLTINNGGSVSATNMNVGRSEGFGSLTVNAGTLSMTGQQTGSVLSGASLSIGNRGGTGTATITNGSTVTISNPCSAGASLNIGGTPVNPLGTGTLNVSDSTINVIAQPGLASMRVGHDGTGTATISASTVNIGSLTATAADGSVIIAGQPGSTGTLTLSAGTVLNTGYVGVGATPSAVVGVQNPGGTGQLILNDSTVNTTTFEIGALGLLSGDGGVINASGNVIVGGTISPGNSPGRITINCNLITLDGSRLVLDILDTGAGYSIDHLIIGNDATFDLSKLQVIFNFLGNTDPTAFAASGGFDLDNFIESQNLLTGEITGLSTVFGAGQDWSTVIDGSRIAAQSDVFDVTSLRLSADGSFAVTTAAIPEPSTWALMLIGMALMGVAARRRALNAAGR